MQNFDVNNQHSILACGGARWAWEKSWTFDSPHAMNIHNSRKNLPPSVAIEPVIGFYSKLPLL
jgi:hypothetical protein